MNELPLQTKCLRCQRPCRTGTPDPKARAIRHSSTTGFCPDCMITKFLLSIEAVRNVIEGTPERGELVKSRPGLGPEIFLGDYRTKTLKPILDAILAHTQMREDEINWIEVVGNWGMPWPKGRGPQSGDY